MMQAVVLKCKAGTMFHFGQYAPDTDTALGDTSLIMHSDSLFSALVTTYSDLFDDTDAFVKQFRLGNIRISSLYFCIFHDDKAVWFLPKPVIFNLGSFNDYKTFRKISFISRALWERLEFVSDLETMYQDGEIIVLQNEFAFLSNELNLPQSELKEFKIYHNPIIQKVEVRKVKRDGGLFQLNTIEIADNSYLAGSPSVHFYFLLTQTGEFKIRYGQNLLQTLHVLAQTGIGGERSTIGKIEESISFDDWVVDTTGSNYCTLSLLSPAQEELKNIQFGNTLLRGGRRVGAATGYQLQKSVRVLAEGAILTNDCIGRLPDVTPENNNGTYLRCGTSVNIQIPDTWIR